MIDEVKETYASMQLDAAYQQIRDLLAKENCALDRKFLRERITETGKFLSEAIQELTRQKKAAYPSPSARARAVSVETPAFTPESLSTPKNDQQATLGFDRQSSSKKPSILKAGKYASAKQQRHEEAEGSNKRKSRMQVFLDADLKQREDYTFDSYDEDSGPRQAKTTALDPGSASDREPVEKRREQPVGAQPLSKSAANDQQVAKQVRPPYEPKPTTDVFLNNCIANPGLWLVESFPLGPAIVPTCLTSLSLTEIVVGTSSGLLIVTDLKSSRRLQVADGPIVGLKARGRLLAVCVDSPAHNLCLLDLDFPDDVMFLQGHSRAVADVAWSDGGRSFLSAGKDGKLNLWNWDPLSLLKSLKVSNLPLNAVACLAKSDLVAVGGDEGCIKVFAVGGGNLQYRNTLQDSAAITKLDSFYQNTKFVASANLLGELKVWDLSSGE